MNNTDTLLFTALNSLSSEEEYAEFLKDLLTPKELSRLTNRLWVFLLLRNGSNQRKVVEETGVAGATVSRASRALAEGGGGIDIVAERLQYPPRDAQ